MTHKERVLLAIEHKEPDRVPVDVWYTPEMKQKMIEYLRLPAPKDEMGPDPLFLEMGHDLLRATIGPAASYYLKDEDYYTDEWGIGWQKVFYGEGYYTEPVGHPLKGIKSPDEFSIPDFTDERRYAKVRFLLDNYGDEYAIVGEITCTLFELAWYLRGMETVMRDFLKNKDFMHAYLDKLKNWAKTAGSILVKMGVDIIFLGDDFGMQDRMMVSPQIFREFFKPRYAELFEGYRRINPNIKIAFHTDGNVEPIIPDFIEIGLNILNPVQPRSMDPTRLKREFGNKLTFWGTIDNQYTMPFGSVQEVVDEVISRLRTVAPQGGLIIGPAHNVQPNTPIENLMAFYKTVTERGIYPIRI